jgi:deoxyribonuclease V
LNQEVEHPWNVTPEEAREIQQRLRAEVISTDELGPVRFVAGIDVAFEDDNSVARGAVAVLRFPELELCESAVVHRSVEFPYIPSLLSFREAPAALEALQSLRRLPDLLLCDGQGLAHPRRFGLACHIGVLSQTPSIGVAKTLLTGVHEPVPVERGSWRPLLDDGEVVGAAVRTVAGVKPLFVSVGHRISLTTAIEYVLRCAPRYRLPETTRWAHRIASQIR